MSALGRILVVAEDSFVRALLGDYFASQGYKPTEAGDADDAVAAVLRDCPDLMLLDVGLPNLNHVDVLERVRTDHPEIQVILITGNPDLGLTAEMDAIDAMDLDRLSRAVACSMSKVKRIERGASPGGRAQIDPS
jgi:two-component system, response regulator, stage 0 sporulation protein F